MVLNYKPLCIQLAPKGLKEIDVIAMAGLTTNVMAQMGKNKPITLKDLEREYAKHLTVHLRTYSLLMMNMLKRENDYGTSGSSTWMPDWGDCTWICEENKCRSGLLRSGFDTGKNRRYGRIGYLR